MKYIENNKNNKNIKNNCSAWKFLSVYQRRIPRRGAHNCAFLAEACWQPRNTTGMQENKGEKSPPSFEFEQRPWKTKISREIKKLLVVIRYRLFTILLEKGSINDFDRLTFHSVRERAIIIAVIGKISLTAPIMIGI